MQEMEYRFLPQTETELRLEDRASGLPTIIGYAAVFNSLSHELPGGFRELIMPGAFTQALAEGADVLARLDHQGLLGRTRNNTLRLTEDQRGLRYEIDTPDTQAGRDLVALIQRGDISGSSFGFKVRRPGGDTWRTDNGQRIRELRSVSLLDVSPVVSPAYPATEVALRSLSEFEQAQQPQALGRLFMRLALAQRS